MVCTLTLNTRPPRGQSWKRIGPHTYSYRHPLALHLPLYHPHLERHSFHHLLLQLHWHLQTLCWGLVSPSSNNAPPPPSTQTLLWRAGWRRNFASVHYESDTDLAWPCCCILVGRCQLCRQWEWQTWLDSVATFYRGDDSFVGGEGDTDLAWLCSCTFSGWWQLCRWWGWHWPGLTL